ncbi:MAG: hypothetical protein EA366_09935 [Spirulina sp. DLM2.Bin59]|nr:MAG: hypothetical protein EA366_09935 [Spirulina sp. DLM2.Bin59]
MGDFARSLGEVIIDITALEVNTMVVKQITGDKFMPWDAYLSLYSINTHWTARGNIHESLHHRYMSLRRDLEVEYLLLVCNPESELFDPNIAQQQDQLLILSDPNALMDIAHSHLPNPLIPHNTVEMQKVQDLLHNSKFSRTLRKVAELKAALDNRNRILNRMDLLPPAAQAEAVDQEIKTDVIYAQTVIQLDGDIINRYNEDLLSHPHRELLLQIHKESVTSGERQWRELLGFILDLAQKTFAQLGNVLSGSSKR